MQLTIEIGDDPKTLHILARWPSVSRTFDDAIGLLNDVDDDEQQSMFTADELVTLRQPLDMIHNAIRTALWKIESETGKSFGPTLSTSLRDERV